MSRVILIDDTAHGKAAALVEDGQLEDLILDPPGDAASPAPGAIYRGIMDRPVKGLGGGFVRLPGGAQGFVRDTKGLAPGKPVLLQVSTFPEAHKSAPMVRRILFKSRYCIVTPEAPGLNIARSIRDEDLRDDLQMLAKAAMEGSEFGLILRSAAAGADLDAVAEDVAAMRDLAEAVLGDDGTAPELLLDAPGAEDLAWRDWDAGEVIAEPGAFERFDIWGAIEGLKHPRTDLADGWMSVDVTPALVAIDVNAGGDFSPAAALRANRAAARAIPRALRLRGLGGQVLVDFAPMSKRDRRDLEVMLKAAFRADPVETSLAGWSNLGLYELQRKRERRPLTVCL